MKIHNIISAVVLSAASLTFTGCNTLKTAQPAQEQVGASRSAVRGQWQVTDIAYNGVTKTAVTSLFSDAKPECFMGSTWVLNGNGLGSYTIPEGQQCSAGARNISWAADTRTGNFSFKRLQAQDKAIKVRDGYVMQYTAPATNQLQLSIPIDNFGTPATVVFTMQRVNNGR